eukprot:TRINITY_DN8896_c1_g1_i1.p1 TRINITY_DN8896_c1_g1~~TRINITY_DN8896_c1_g1_i1.p1  ORF type:complete len:695 (+),score=116.17 TRINITY_DN8896_c1_g1_i1:29-2113(+)
MLGAVMVLDGPHGMFRFRGDVRPTRALDFLRFGISGPSPNHGRRICRSGTNYCCRQLDGKSLGIGNRPWRVGSCVVALALSMLTQAEVAVGTAFAAQSPSFQSPQVASGGTMVGAGGKHKFAAVSALQSRDELLAIVRDAGARPLIIQFWSETCAFCHIMFPVFQLVAEKHKGRAFFLQVDTQQVPELAEMFQVYGLPSFKSVLGGQLQGGVDGADTRGLEDLVAKSVRAGDRHDLWLPQENLVEFIRAYDAESTRSSTVDTTVEAWMRRGRALGDLPALLDELELRYGARPRTTGGFIPGMENSASGKEEGTRRPVDYRTLEADEIRAEIRLLQQELWNRDAASQDSNPCAEARAAKRNAGSDSVSKAVERVVVLGGGPAGLAATLYAARAGLCPVAVAPLLGGQLLAKGVDVENYPGVGRTRGVAIVEDMRAQARGFFADLRDDIALSVNVQTRPFEVHLNSSSTLLAEALIVATGADSRWLGIKGEDTFRGRGVSSCAACDGYIFRGKRCAVIGGGETAMEEALFLARICASVVIIHRRDQFRGREVLQQRVLDHPKIAVRWDTLVHEFVGEDSGTGDVGATRLTALLLKDATTGEAVGRLPTDSAFVAIGHDPNTALLRDQVRMVDGTGYLEVSGRTTYTSVPGVFAAGDVADPKYRQAVTAAGSGAAAALDAERWLSERGGSRVAAVEI